jgi:hypothetical protein
MQYSFFVFFLSVGNYIYKYKLFGINNDNIDKEINEETY